MKFSYISINTTRNRSSTTILAPIIICSIIPNHLRQLGDNSFTRFDRQCCQNCWQPQDVCSVIELNMSSGGRQPEGYQMVMSDTKVHLRVLLCSNPILYNIGILQCILFNSSSHQWYHHIAEFIISMENIHTQHDIRLSGSISII